MTYSIFNRDSGNLIESFRGEKRAFAFVAGMLEDDDNDPESIALVFSEKGKTVRMMSGDELRAAVAAHARHVPA